jgi:hypothetical protein
MAASALKEVIEDLKGTFAISKGPAQCGHQLPNSNFKSGGLPVRA